MARADENSNEFDNLFSKTDESGADDDFLSSLGDSQNFESSELFGSNASNESAESADGIGASSFDSAAPIGSSAAFDSAGSFASDSASFDSAVGGALDDESLEIDAKGKKGKKEKKAKAARAKKEKAPRAKKEKGERVRYGSPTPFIVLGVVFLLLIAAGNVAAFATAGAGAVPFAIFFNLLGLVLLAVPAFLLWQQTSQRVGLFDVALALVAAFLTIGCMAILASQAKNYGATSKVASAAPAVVRTIDRA